MALTRSALVSFFVAAAALAQAPRLDTVSPAQGRPVPGVRVELTAPASGATSTLANAAAITDVHGLATTTCPTGCVVGSYSVTARAAASSAAASATLTNPGGPCRRRAARH